MRISPGIILATILFLLSSCDGNRVFEGKKDFDDRLWKVDDPAEFQFEIVETDKLYNLLVSVRNSAKYPFQNIYLQYYLQDSTGRVLSKDLKNIQLFNSKTGIPLGKGLGDLYDIEKPILEDYSFNQMGKYTFRIDQFMRQDSLLEVMSVGFRVEIAE